MVMSNVPANKISWWVNRKGVCVLKKVSHSVIIAAMNAHYRIVEYAQIIMYAHNACMVIS